MNMRPKTRSWKPAALLCLTGLLLPPAQAELDIRHPVQTWDIRTTTAQQYQPVQLYRSESMTFDLQARNGRTPVDLTGTNTIVTWEICDWDNLTNVYLAVTGSVLNATNGQVRYTLDRSQSDTLENGTYKGFAWARQGTNNAGILAAQQLRILGTPATRYATMEPIPYAWDTNASNLLTETAARIAADSALSNDWKILEADFQALETNTAAQIATETAARSEADSALQSDIAAETAARSAADTDLQSDISAETAARSAADTALQSDITAETEARIAADAAISPTTIYGTTIVGVHIVGQ